MIRHVVMWTIKHPERAANIERALCMLHALPARIPEILELNAGENLCDAEPAFDLVLEATFKDSAALAAYQEHPAHRAFSEFITSVRSERVIVDYEIGEGGGC